MTGEMYNIKVVTEGMQLVGLGKGSKEDIDNALEETDDKEGEE